MRRYMLTGREEITFQADAPRPDIGPEEVLLKVEACTVCNRSDLIYYKYLGVFDHCTPRGFGHEVGGTVEEVGAAVTAWRPGDRVFARSLLSTGYADFAAARAAKLGRLPDDLPFAEGAILQLAPLVYTATKPILPGHRVFIAGQGPVGLLATQFARLRGASDIIVCDLDAWRLSIAEQLGATETRLTSAALGAPFAARAEEVDVYIDAVGRPSTISMGVQAVRPGGKLVMLGTHHIEHVVPIDLVQVERKAIDLLSSRERTPGEEDEALRAVERLVAAKRLRTDLLLTHHYPLEDLQQALDQLLQTPLVHAEAEVGNDDRPPPRTLKVAITA